MILRGRKTGRTVGAAASQHDQSRGHADRDCGSLRLIPNLLVDLSLRDVHEALLKCTCKASPGGVCSPIAVLQHASQLSCPLVHSLQRRFLCSRIDLSGASAEGIIQHVYMCGLVFTRSHAHEVKQSATKARYRWCCDEGRERLPREGISSSRQRAGGQVCRGSLCQGMLLRRSCSHHWGSWERAVGARESRRIPSRWAPEHSHIQRFDTAREGAAGLWLCNRTACTGAA